MINPKAPSTYSLDPPSRLVKKAEKPEHYLASLSLRITAVRIPSLLCAQRRLSVGVGGGAGQASFKRKDQK